MLTTHIRTDTHTTHIRTHTQATHMRTHTPVTQMRTHRDISHATEHRTDTPSNDKVFQNEVPSQPMNCPNAGIHQPDPNLPKQ